MAMEKMTKGKPPLSLKTTALALLIAVGAFTFLLIAQDSTRQRTYFNSWMNSRPRYVPVPKPSSKRIHPSRQEQDDSYGVCLETVSNATSYYPKNELFSIANQSTPPFMPNYKNPCWPGPGENITCIPYVIFAGFTKSATTDLHSRLTSHPLIVGGKSKENHFFSKKMFRKPPCPQEKPTNPNVASCLITEYAHKFYWNAALVIQGKQGKDDKKIPWRNHPKAAEIEAEFERMKREASRIYEHPIITVDSSPSYSFNNDDWRKIEENQGCVLPRALSVDFIAKMNPNVKVIMIMREPVERLFSDYFYMTKKTATTERFHNLTVNFLKYFNECLQKSSLTTCVRAELSQPNSQELRPHVSLYYFHVRDWLRRIPRDQFLFLQSEAYHKDIAGELRKVFDFLGFPPVNDQALECISENRERNVNLNKPKTMYPETRALLNKFYAGYNRQLADLLGDDRFLWGQEK